MKQISTLFLQGVTVLVGIAVFAAMIRFPLTEGRATNLDLFSIYADPFIIYAYVASIAFFVALYQVFVLLGYIRKNQVFSPGSVRALKTVKRCAIILGASIVMAALYVITFHAKDDDPAGFIAVAIVATFISFLIAVVTTLFEKRLLTPTLSA